jgi:hypothetical protein
MLRAGDAILMCMSRLPTDSSTNIGSPPMLPFMPTTAASSVTDDNGAQLPAEGRPTLFGLLR